ncbi:hypothetical protein Acor_03900 [Acrocarpospora corrugata]|uniref:Uncharacterized protein n=1 Tax=Acrocarpospora corrugata TaxID=35763 RepID=A0A5M3VQ41_9ACTN|nr:creatininase family protein [Acrocarpospora corrugata]GER98328.1 hypothetical protein Acor_03900 [Acrocarpospora corrugata]
MSLLHQLMSRPVATGGRDENTNTAIVPIGRGDPLVPRNDVLIAGAIVRELAENYPLRVLPPITVCGPVGPVGFGALALGALLSGVYDSVAKSGVRSLVLVNAGEVDDDLVAVAREASAHGRRIEVFPTQRDWEAAYLSAQGHRPPDEDPAGGAEKGRLILSSLMRSFRSVSLKSG